MIKVVILFLLLLLALSMVGSLVTKFLRGPAPPPELSRAKCAHCGRVVVGTAPCACGKG